MTSILAVDDDETALFALESLLLKEGYTVHTSKSVRETIDKSFSYKPDLILLDLMMPDGTGLDVLKKLREDSDLRYTAIALLTSKDDLEDITRGLDAGADDYIKKPFRSAELLARVKALLRTRDLYTDIHRIEGEKQNLQSQLEIKFSFENITGKSPAIQEVFSLVKKVSPTDVPVLIQGESGTGKELIAKSIHFNSNRKDKPLLIQNCSAFSENLLESELFGHVKGAFSGAHKDKSGLFEVADKGTFFLDEIGEMSLSLQAKLLRVLQDGTFTSVGDTKSKKVDVRVVGATHRDLKEMIEKGTFREDLYYRLNVVTINLPPLRERVDDIEELAERFLKEKSLKIGKKLKTLSKEAIDTLKKYHWPGNIRQLQNEIERAVILSEDESEINPSNFSQELVSQKTTLTENHDLNFDLKAQTELLEKNLIIRALKHTGGNRSESARLLGVSRSSLLTKIGSYDIKD